MAAPEGFLLKDQNWTWHFAGVLRSGSANRTARLKTGSRRLARWLGILDENVSLAKT
jgi:hypothetical protein